MRQYFSLAKSKYLAKKDCDFAPAIIATVCGGYLCFESANDYKTWLNQK